MADELISALQSMRDRMMTVLPDIYGDAFDGDMDTLLEAINRLKRNTRHQPNGGAGADARGVPCVLFPLPNDDEMQALRSFSETAEDDGSYDVPKEMMMRLSMLGAVTRGSRPGWFWLTDFGRVLLFGTTVSSDGAEDARDAARWRWVRERILPSHAKAIVGMSASQMYVADVDAQIRAAMSGQNKGEV